MASQSADLGATARTQRRTRDRDVGGTFTETKAGFKTTEFLFAVAAVVALIIATYVEDANLAANEGWRYASWVVAAYLISRGLAKLGTREPYSTDDSER